MKTIYISGGITGISTYRETFKKAEEFLRTKHNHVPVNPVNIGDALINPSYEDYMKADLKALLNCTHIFMLKNWKKSKGACFELATAKMCGLEIIYDKTANI
jgi:hypothetical protein